MVNERRRVHRRSIINGDERRIPVPRRQYVACNNNERAFYVHHSGKREFGGNVYGKTKSTAPRNNRQDVTVKYLGTRSFDRKIHETV